MHGLVPNSYIHVSVSDYIFPGLVCPFDYGKIDRPILGIYKSLMNVETGRQIVIILSWKWRGHAVSFLGIHAVNRTHLYWILTGPSFAVHQFDKLFSQLCLQLCIKTLIPCFRWLPDMALSSRAGLAGRRRSPVVKISEMILIWSVTKL